MINTMMSCCTSQCCLPFEFVICNDLALTLRISCRPPQKTGSRKARRTYGLYVTIRCSDRSFCTSRIEDECVKNTFLFSPACAKVPVRTTNSHAQSISPASCRSKRVDDHSRFYANFRDFRGARVSTLTLHVLKPNADPVVITLLSSAAHKFQRFQCSALFVVVAEQEIF